MENQRMLEEVLTKLGLNESQIKIYLTLLKVGTTPSSLLAKRAQVPRSTAKYTCEQLVNKKLAISSNKNGTTYYTARDPEASLKLTILQERKAIDKKEEKINMVIGDLKKLFNPNTTMPKVRFYQGVDGLIEMFEETLSNKAPIYGILNVTDNLNPDILEYHKTKYLPTRIQMKQKTRSIFNDNPQVLDYRKQDKEMNRISLIVPEKDFKFEINYHIQGNTVSFFSIDNNDLIGITIDNTHIRNSQLTLFKMAWNFARTLKENKEYKDLELD